MEQGDESIDFITMCGLFLIFVNIYKIYTEKNASYFNTNIIFYGYKFSGLICSIILGKKIGFVIIQKYYS